jgi:hypothetical protein
MSRFRLALATSVCGATLLAAAAAHAEAFAWSPSQMFVQGGAADGTGSVTLGLRWPWSWSWRSDFGGGALTASTEFSLSQWRYDNAAGRRTSLVQLAVSPVLRWRPDGGAARWFLEGGLGLTQTSRRYETERKTFSTRFNFGTQLAVGFDFGERREHEISLRVAHFSNGGIRKPNPGENFLQLRYAFHF